MTKVKRKRPTIACKDDHLTKQDHGGLANINTVAQRYLSGRMPIPTDISPQYADLTSINIQESREILAAAESGFAELPADLRDYFGNDSAEYFGYLDENHETIVADGLQATLRGLLEPPALGITDEPIVDPTASEKADSAQNAENPLPDGQNEGTAQ